MADMVDGSVVGYIEQPVLFGQPTVHGFGSSEFYVKEISRDIANEMVVKNHYSKKFYAASYIHLGLFINRQLLGVLQFGYAMNPTSQGSVVAGTDKDEYLELNRMWVSDDAGRNTESRAISYAIKFIKRRYPKIAWIQSFADERCGRFGVVYQAANFLYFGEHTSVFWELDGEFYHNSLMTRDRSLSKAAAYIQDNKDRAVAHNLRQFRYIFFIKKSFLGRCKLKQCDYPKHSSNAL